MRLSRSIILVVLAGLTICFLGASYAMWFNTNSFALMGTDEAQTPAAAATTGSASEKALRLTVSEPGVTAVTAAQLREAGLPFIDLSPAELNLTFNGQSVPFTVREINGEPALLFYVPEGAAHAPRPVYMLQPGVGTAMPVHSAAPQQTPVSNVGQTLIWEQNNYFVADAPGDDPWMGPMLLAPARWSMALDSVTPGSGPATLLLHLFSPVSGPDAPDHRVTVLLNGQSVAEHRWDGAGPETLSVSLPARLLRPGPDNTVDLLLHENTAVMSEAVYLDGLELHYEGPLQIEGRAVHFTSTGDSVRAQDIGEDLLVFDVSEPGQPAILDDIHFEGNNADFASGAPGRQFVALPGRMARQPLVEPALQWEDSLRDPRWGADYVAIVADVNGFVGALEPLLAARRDEGLRVAAVPLTQIFDEFSHGQRDPAAIRAFLAHAAANWEPPAPRYVLLAGDATVDVADRALGRNRNRLPTALVSSAGERVASDGWFAGSSDGAAAPQIAVGRFPAQNTPQLSAMVEKTLTYEEALRAGADDWAAAALLIQDEGAAFETAAHELAQQLDDGGYDVYRLETNQESAARHGVLSAINQGVGLVTYVGEGSESAWGRTAALQNSDVAALTNSTRLPLLATFTCRSGSFASPEADSLAETLLRSAGGGIVAAVAPAGHIPAGQALPLATAFQDALLQEQPARLGDVLLALQGAAQEQPDLRAALSAVNLLGDPALRLGRPGG